MWSLIVANPLVGAGTDATGAFAKLTAGAGAPALAGLYATPEYVLARPPTGALDGAPKVGGLPIGDLQEYSVGCCLE